VPEPIDELIRRHGPDAIIEALRPQTSDERMERIENVLDARVDSVTVVIENLYDPHNGAAAMRSVEAFGLTTMHFVDPGERFTASSKVTIGCDKWVNSEHHQGIDNCAKAIHEQGGLLYATLPDADLTLEDVDVSKPVALVFGNEHDGLSERAIEVCDRAVRIPMFGFTRSFNLSVSVALCLSRVTARRREHLGASGDLEEAERTRLRARWYALGVRGVEGIIARHVSK
jgi:tRNA (guanosine-2'-O-)-methyltransferase